jgi:hypothetical protein
VARYEPIKSEAVKKWAYQSYKKHDCLFTVDLQREGFPIVAELIITISDREQLPELDGVKNLIMFSKYNNKSIDRTKFDNNLFRTEEYLEPLAFDEIEFYILRGE